MLEARSIKEYYGSSDDYKMTDLLKGSDGKVYEITSSGLVSHVYEFEALKEYFLKEIKKN